MTIKTWINEFYPVKPLKGMSRIDMYEIMLLMWKGCLPVNIIKHGFIGWYDLADSMIKLLGEDLERAKEDEQ